MSIKFRQGLLRIGMDLYSYEKGEIVSVTVTDYGRDWATWRSGDKTGQIGEHYDNSEWFFTKEDVINSRIASLQHQNELDRDMISSLLKLVHDRACEICDLAILLTEPPL